MYGQVLFTMYHAGGDELQLQNIYLVVRGIDAENGGLLGNHEESYPQQIVDF